MAHTSRNHKDTLFVDLFCEDRDGKKNFLDLYNSLNGTQLRLEDTEIKDVRIDGVLYTTMRNDVSMLVDNRIVVLCEQQSTVNENMPLRCLLYIARIYEQLLDTKSRFKRRLQQLPAPEFFVFYNGTDDLPEQQELHLKDAFIKDSPLTDAQKSALPDLTVLLYNLNKPTGKAAWEKCRALTDYNAFVTMIREEQSVSHEGFMARAIKRAVKADVLPDYLARKSREIENMFFGEYDYATDVAVQREEAHAIGLAEGLAEGSRTAKLETARNFLAMHLPIEQIAQGTGLPLAEVQQLASECC